MLLDDWMQMYEKAWRAEDIDLLSSVFTEDVSYKVSPFKEPMAGLEKLKKFWQEKRDGPDEAFEMTHELVALEGDRAVVRVDVHYKAGDHWKDLWILNFATDGRCSSFEEWPFKPNQDDGQD